MSIREDIPVICVTELPGSPTTDVRRPSEIRISGGMVLGGFGKAEVNLSAGRLISFMMEQGDSWVAFTLTNLTRFYISKGWDPNLILNGLTGAWVDIASSDPWLYETEIFIVCLLNGQFCITKEFVMRCGR